MHATTHNIYQHSEGEGTFTPASIPSKSRRQSVIEPTAFCPTESHVKLKDRQEARSLTGIDKMPTLEQNQSASSGISNDDMVWHLLRMAPTEQLELDELSVPLTWNAFNEILSPEFPQTTIAYGPIFPSSPTNPDVVKSSVDYFMTLSRKLGQDDTVITCDQAIYDIVKGLVKKYPQQYTSLVVRLGGFHIAENFLGTIGFFMKGSGIEDILSSLGIFGKGTINKIISGRDYYKMLFCHSIVSEAMIRIKWEAFEKSLMESDKTECLVTLTEKLNDLIFILNDDENTHDVNTVNTLEFVKVALTEMQNEWDTFENDMGVTAQFWTMYINMVNILKGYVRAERAGIWDEHLAAVQRMLPYTISSGHIRYASCLPIYLHDMAALPAKHPQVHEQFVMGNFTVHRTSGKFNGVWADLALEQTYNREGKTSLLKGITMNPTATEKYVKSAPLMTKVSESVKSMVHLNKQSLGHHHGESAKSSEGERAMIVNIKHNVESSMINPFRHPNKTDLVNVATGQKAGSTELVDAHTKGVEALKHAQDMDSYKILVPKIETFASQQHSKQPKETLLKIYQDESAVVRTLCFLQNSAFKEEAFSHEWTSYSPSLFEVEP